MRGFGIALTLLACICCANALSCYVCNSQSDPDCDSTVVRKEYLSDCSVGRKNNATSGTIGFRPVPNAKVCWKQRQSIEGKIIIDRVCGEEVDSKTYSCYDRIGTKNIKVHYCVCNRSGCNGAGGLAASAAPIALMMLTVSFFVSSAVRL